MTRLTNSTQEPAEFDDPETHRMQSVWRSVLLQMILDLKSQSAKKEALENKRQALAWFASEHFETVCDLAGYDPDRVRRCMREARQRGFEWRKPAGEGWRVKKRLSEQAKAKGE